MKIAVRAGHNLQAIGAIGLIRETEEALKVKDALIKYLKKLGHEVLDVTPGKCDEDTDLAYGVNKANAWGAKLFISVHFNKAYASYNGKIGSEVCVYSTFKTAQRVVDKLGSLGFKNRGLKVRGRGLYELRETDMDAMIAEVCFVEATEDVALYKKLGPDAIGKAIAEGITNKNISAPAVKPTPPTAPSKLYRVRKTWADISSQIGAFANLDSAKDLVDKNKSYKVFDESGKVVYSVAVNPPTTEQLYRVRKNWADGFKEGNQIGSFKELEGAKEMADKNTGYKVFDISGKVVYTPKSKPAPAPTPTPTPTPDPIPTEPVMKIIEEHFLIGKSELTAYQMSEYLLKNNKSPKINCSAYELAEIYLKEGELEGVRGDIAFMQACHETGWFKFGGDAKPEWNNFAGIGVTGAKFIDGEIIKKQFVDGVIELKNKEGKDVGIMFNTPTLGVRTQIQHLKAYATATPLKETCVDPRYKYVSPLGKAPTLEDLAGKWAVPGYPRNSYKSFTEAWNADATYGQLIWKLHKDASKFPKEAPVTEKPSQSEDDRAQLEKNFLSLIVDFLVKLFSMFGKK